MGRSLHLTAAGEELLPYAIQAIELLREAGETLSAMRGLKPRVLKLGAVSTAKYFAPSLLPRFHARLPGDHDQVLGRQSRKSSRNCAANDIDLVIMGRPPRELETEAEAFAKHPLVIIAAPDHPLAGKRRISTPATCRREFPDPRAGFGDARVDGTGVPRSRRDFRVSMEVSSNETIKQAVMAGMGISFISMHTISPGAQGRQADRAGYRRRSIIRDWYVIHLRDKRLSPVAAAFSQLPARARRRDHPRRGRVELRRSRSVRQVKT